MAYDYDLIVIGSGPAGERAAVSAGKLGKRVAMVEREPRHGGAAVHTGTLPSKTLRETALFLQSKRERALYGVAVSVDRSRYVPKLLARKEDVVGLEVDRIDSSLANSGVETIRGIARIADAHRVSVQTDGGSRGVTADHILVATGSVPFRPDFIPFEDPAIDDSDTVLLLEKMPDSLVVIGAGVIGSEYTSIFAALGVRVSLVEPRDELLPFLDADMSAALLHAFEEDLNVDVHMNRKAAAVVREGEHIVTTLDNGEQIKTDRVLYAAGRSGATSGLGLADVGVKLDRRSYIEVDADFRTAVPSILAAGDVIGFPMLASTSMEQGRAAISRLYGQGPGKVALELLPYGIYTIPELSCVGLSQEDAEAAGRDVVIGRARYMQNARAKILGDHEGVVKLVFERDTRRLIGAHLMGAGATELIHIGQAIITLGGSVDTIAQSVFNYPTLAMCYKDAADDALIRWGA